MILLSNERISAKINPFGAELVSFVNEKHGLEYIWQAGKEWPKHSPVLFPIVGSLKGGTYIYNGNKYRLERHGLARAKEFKVVSLEDTKASFILDDDEETFQVYPFHFELQLDYVLKDDQLEVIYIVRNKGNETMFFSIGAHPAFKVPLVEGDNYNDYYLEFNKEENAGIWPLEDGLLANAPTPFVNGNRMDLRKDLFLNDALVFKNLRSDEVSICSRKHKHGVTMRFKGFPYYGIWAAKNADFVCLEPWQGITDSLTSSGKIEEKEGIIALQAGNSFYCSWTLISR